MRICLALLLAFLLPLNAAYAASVGVCDTLGHTSGRAAHFGHHVHEHGGVQAQDDHQAGSDAADGAGSAGGHHHDHVHSGFSSVPQNDLGIAPLTGRSPLVATPPHLSLPESLSLPERPPRAVLA